MSLVPFAIFSSADVNNQLGAYRLISNLFSKESIHVRRLRNKDFSNTLIAVLKNNEYDIIQIETIYPTQYLESIRTHSKAKIVVRCHNAEHVIWKRLSKNAPPWKRWYLKLQSERIEKFEIHRLNQADLILPLSRNDQMAFRDLGVDTFSKYLPIGLDMSKYQCPEPAEKKDKLTLCFIGTLDWQPNSEGLLWFLKEIWPDLIHNHKESIELHIAGRKIPVNISNYASPQIIVHGEVPDAKKFICNYDVMIVPLFAGSGVRVKILEAMALGKMVISTSIGVEGISGEDGKHMIIANDRNAFVRAIDNLIMKEYDFLEMKVRNQDLIKSDHNSSIIGESLIAEYQRLLTR